MYTQVTKRLEFDEEKAIESILYIAHFTTDLYIILKILYRADKHHLNNFGRLIFGEHYARLPYGATPSDSYDLLKGLRGDGEQEFKLRYNNDIEVEGDKVTAKREANLEYLSKSDVDCLDAAIKELKDKSFDENKNLAHDESYNASNEHFISIDDFIINLSNKEKLKNHFKDSFA